MLSVDVRQALRLFRTQPRTVLVAVLSLALGVSVNLTLFGVVQAVFFYETTVSDPDRVVAVQPGNSNQWSYLNYRDLKASGIFESVAGYRRVQLNLRNGSVTERLSGLAVTPRFFDALGVRLAMGRGFGETEAAPERQPRLAVLSHRFWRSQFGSRIVVGERLTLNGEPFDIVGVLPERYRPVTLFDDPAVYVPLSTSLLPNIVDRTNSNALGVLGRLRPGGTPEQMQTAVTTLGGQLETAYPVENAAMSRPARVLPLTGGERAGARDRVAVMAILFSILGIVLLSACANVAALLMARVARRQRELAIHVAMGAHRRRLIRMLLTESLGIATVGGIAGAALSLWLMALLRTITVPGAGSVVINVEPNVTLWLYAAMLVVATAVLCGVIPAWRASRTNVVANIQSGDGYGATGRLWFRHTLVVGQVAVSLTLLVLAGLLLQTLARIASVDPGFAVDRLVVASLFVPGDRYARDGGVPLAERLVERLQATPGVESASFAGIIALGGDGSAARFHADGQSGSAPGARTLVNTVSPGYFGTMGIPVLRGRDFNRLDRDGTPAVAIVSQAFERAYFPGATALGRRIRQDERSPLVEIVGVVADSNYGSFGEAPAPLFYSAYLQRPQVSTQVRPLILHVRTAGAPGAMTAGLQRIIHAVDPTISAEVRTMREATSLEANVRAFGTRMLGGVGGLALVLTMLGLNGLIAFVVSSKEREFGTRMALGADTGRILREIMGRSLRLIAIGLALGSALSWLAARAFVGGLAGVSPLDPVAFGASIAVVMTVGLASSYMPARRATRVDPLVALRQL